MRKETISGTAEITIEGASIPKGTREVVVSASSRKFGWGYSFTPSGRDAWSIKAPSGPDVEGTLGQCQRFQETDPTWLAHHVSAFHATAWFYRGKRIVATWGFGLIGRPSDDEAAAMDDEQYYDACRYGDTWLPGLHLPERWPGQACRPATIRLLVEA